MAERIVMIGLLVLVPMALSLWAKRQGTEVQRIPEAEIAHQPVLLPHYSNHHRVLFIVAKLVS